VKGGSKEDASRFLQGRNLDLATREITDGINGMSVAADQVNRAPSGAGDLSDGNRKNISVLVKAVSKFKV